MTTLYQGLEQYQREQPDPLAQRPGESAEAHTRRIAPFLRHAEAVEDPAWTEHRARVDHAVGSGSGMFGRATPEERAVAAGGTHGFGGSQKVEPNGHLGSVAVPGSVAIPRVYVSEVGEDQAKVSPLTAHLRSSGDGWQ